MKLKNCSIKILFIIFVLTWCLLLLSVFETPRDSTGKKKTKDIKHEILQYEESFDHKTSFRSIKVNNAPSFDEISNNMTLYLTTLHNRLASISGPKVTSKIAWDTFFDVTKSMPMVWDEENKYRLSKPRNDNSIFVSLGTYRDPFCPMTIKSLYSQSKNPEKLFVSLFQQNCFEPVCRTGVLKGGKVENAGPDIDCYLEFCKSKEGIESNACNNGNVRLYNTNESESLGPYMARYLGSKFYRGEEYYLQIDSHSEFVLNWDEKLIKMIKNTKAKKPVLSTYPPDSGHKWKDTPGFRMCDSMFATSDIEWQIIRLGSSRPFGKKAPELPTYAPFVAAGFLFAPATMLQEVPFDPFLPWIFMGEEISMSARLWTSGYDIFSPTSNVLNHYYVRRHYPKFWESVNRSFKKPIHNQIVAMVIKRIKNMLKYPESISSAIEPATLLFKLSNWGMGTERKLEDYMNMVGIDVNLKTIKVNTWCLKGQWPDIAKQYRIE